MFDALGELCHNHNKCQQIDGFRFHSPTALTSQSQQTSLNFAPSSPRSLLVLVNDARTRLVKYTGMARLPPSSAP